MNKRERKFLEKDLADALVLKSRINNALSAMGRFDGYRDNVKETEVSFRYDAVVGMLLMASNDVCEMADLWRKDLSEK